MLSREAVFGNAEGPNNKKRVLLAVAAVLAVGLAVGGFLLWRWHNHKTELTAVTGAPKATGREATTKQEENRYNSAINNTLQSGDTVGYETAQLSLAYGYLLQKDYSSAARLLDDIKQKVAAKDLQPTYYLDRLQVDQHSGDTAAQKADLQALIPLLRAQHRDAEADALQKQLDAL